jgi:hypothetical protein
LGMWLALRAGYGAYLDDTQRLVLARLLPSQITAEPEPSGRVDDGTFQHNDGPRAVGAYGGVHVTPHGGKTSVIDVTAAVVHTLADVYTHIVTRDATGMAVHLALDYADDQVQVTVQRGERAVVRVRPQTRTALRVRVPGWAPAASVALTVSGQPYAAQVIGGYVLVPAERLPATVELSYALPARETVEAMPHGPTYHLHWRGDEIVGITPNDAYRPFYPSAVD